MPQAADLVTWTSLILQQNRLPACSAEEMHAVLQTRDKEEVLMLSGDMEDTAYFL